MINLNTYIIEKLKIDKDTKVELKFPVNVEIWHSSKDIYKVRDIFHDYSNIVRFGITDKKEKDESNDLYLYSIEVENRKDLLSLLIFCYHIFVIDDYKAEHFCRMDEEGVKERIKNYDEIEDYIDSYTNKEYQEALDNVLKLNKTK